MRFIPENFYHIYNEGNNKQLLFFDDKNYHSFIDLYNAYVVPHCETICWCLMPNHFHFMVYTDERCEKFEKQGGLLLDPITNGFRKLLSGYAHNFNKSNNRTGSLFRPKTKSKCLSSEDYKSLSFLYLQNYLLSCFEYIHQNPVRAGLVDKAENWAWSSFCFYKGVHKVSFCNKELAEKYLGITF
ncbi:MAG TPA: hypothetical protein VFN30_06900 [Chitinophagaceae bacterium]|nr:hypothetical protein [Chitinophagaceae bacterium]